LGWSNARTAGTTTSEHYRWERIADHYLGFVHLAYALITFQAVTGFAGSLLVSG
jgi:hypothetical protein